MKRYRAFFACALSLLTGFQSLNAADIDFEASAGAALPVGGDAAVFKTGYGASLAGGLTFDDSSPFRIRTAIDYTTAPVDTPDNLSIGIIRFMAGGSYRFLRAGAFDFGLEASAGWYRGALSDGSGSDFNPALEGGVTAAYSGGFVTPFIKAAYTNALGLTQDVSVRGGVLLDFTSKGAKQPKQKAVVDPPAPKVELKQKSIKSGPAGLQIMSITTEPIFPVFFRYYETNPLGYIVVKNSGAATLETLIVDVLVKQYMDDAKESPGPMQLKPGEEVSIPLYALFNDSILSVSEGNKVSGSVSLSYIAKGKKQQMETTTAFTLYDRNSIAWTDDRRAAAFVTAKDPVVLRFSKNLAGLIEDSRKFSIPPPLVAGLGVFESLRRYGMRYVVDPNSSYETVSRNEDVIDFIQFPRQTLDFKAGDCDDLSVLTATLLESLGVRAAFITIPGHIFVALDLGISPENARTRFSPDMLVIRDSRVWLPVEITALGDDFFKAWELGAREWREADAKKLAAIYPVAEAWSTYAPVGFIGEAAQVQVPETSALTSDCIGKLETHMKQQLAPVIAKIESDMKKDGRTSTLLNRIGVQYASAGLRATARTYLNEAVAKQDFAPALLNLGNLAYLEKDFQGSLELYQRAYNKNSQTASTVLAMARIHHELENYGQAREFFTKLKQMDAQLASRYAYIDLRGEEAKRAAESAGIKETVEWAN